MIGQHVAKAMAEKAAALMGGNEPEPDVEIMEPVAAEPTMAAVMLQFAEILKELKTANTDEARSQALSQADILQQILIKTKPENTSAPMAGVFNPRGERDFPKPPLQCQMFWVGFDLKVEQHTPEEVDLLNKLGPLTCMVTKADGSRIPFTVTAVRGGDLKIERLEIWFPCKGEARHNHGSMVSYLKQALGEAIPTADELQAELTALKAQFAA